MDKLQRGHEAAEVLGVVRGDFAERERELVKEATLALVAGTLTPTDAYAYIARMAELRKYTDRLDRHVRDGQRERDKHMK